MATGKCENCGKMTKTYTEPNKRIFLPTSKHKGFIKLRLSPREIPGRQYSCKTYSGAS